MLSNNLVIDPETEHLHEMLTYWEVLSTVPVDLDGRIAVPFAQFEVGTPRVDIFELFTEFNADIFDEYAAKNGDFSTPFDGQKSRIDITINLDPRNQVRKNFYSSGDGVDGIDSVDEVEESQREEVGYALGEIKKSFENGNNFGSDRREHGETSYSFANSDVRDLTDVDDLKAELLGKLEDVRKLVDLHVNATGLKSEDCQQTYILNNLRETMDAVRGLTETDVVTHQTTPVLIDVRAYVDATLHEDDEAIPGRYLINIPSNYSHEQMASIALDSFHAQFGISQLDDFTFTVIDGSRGVKIFEAEDAESYQWDHLNLTVECLGEVPVYDDEDPLAATDNQNDQTPSP